METPETDVLLMEDVPTVVGEGARTTAGATDTSNCFVLSLLAAFVVHVAIKIKNKYCGDGPRRSGRRYVNHPFSLKRTITEIPMSLYEDVDSMLAGSYLIQDIALFNHWDEIVGKGTIDRPDFFKDLPKKASEIKEWIHCNMDTFKKAKLYTLKKYDADFSLDIIQGMLARNLRNREYCGRVQKGEELTLELLDDEFGFDGRSSKPVYGISRNPQRKRLTVCFRGSISSKDWEQDAKAAEREVSLTEEFRHHIPKPDEELLKEFTEHVVTVHKGFFEYLFETEHKDDCNKFEGIMKEIITRLNEPRNKGYTLYFTGHSLGAALATLAATACALSNIVEKTVYLITFASPHVGKRSFVEAFHKLEEAGKIRHLRITNDDDAVPQGFNVLGFMHTASVHLNMFSSTHGGEGYSKLNPLRYFSDGEMEINYQISVPSIDEVCDQKMNVNHKWLMGNPSHALQKHKPRFDENKAEFSCLTLDDLFDGSRNSRRLCLKGYASF